MFTAIVLIESDPQRIQHVAEEAAAITHVSEVYSVTGEIDLIAIVRVAEHDQLSEVITSKLNRIEGIRSTRTHLAFRTYSREHLEAAFALGIEE